MTVVDEHTRYTVVVWFAALLTPFDSSPVKRLTLYLPPARSDTARGSPPPQGNLPARTPLPPRLGRRFIPNGSYALTAEHLRSLLRLPRFYYALLPQRPRYTPCSP